MESESARSPQMKSPGLHTPGVEILKKSCWTTSPSGFSEPIISHLKAVGPQAKAAGPMEKLPAKTSGPAVISTLVPVMRVGKWTLLSRITAMGSLWCP